MDVSFIITFLAATVAAGTPILFAAAGEMIAERSGVMNLGVEGMMLVGRYPALWQQ
jgi:simple sugar transport system permease protein